MTPQPPVNFQCRLVGLSVTENNRLPPLTILYSGVVTHVKAALANPPTMYGGPTTVTITLNFGASPVVVVLNDTTPEAFVTPGTVITNPTVFTLDTAVLGGGYPGSGLGITFTIQPQ